MGTFTLLPPSLITRKLRLLFAPLPKTFFMTAKERIWLPPLATIFLPPPPPETTRKIITRDDLSSLGDCAFGNAPVLWTTHFYSLRNILYFCQTLSLQPRSVRPPLESTGDPRLFLPRRRHLRKPTDVCRRCVQWQ